MSIQKRQQLMNALGQVEEFVLKHQEAAMKSGRKEAWDRDWGVLQTAREVLARFDQQELRRFMDIDVRGLSHYFGSYADDREVGLALDTLYRALQEAIRPESLDGPEQLDLK